MSSMETFSAVMPPWQQEKQASEESVWSWRPASCPRARLPLMGFGGQTMHLDSKGWTRGRHPWTFPCGARRRLVPVAAGAGLRAAVAAGAPIAGLLPLPVQCLWEALLSFRLSVLTVLCAGPLRGDFPPRAQTTCEMFGNMFSVRPRPRRACLRMTTRAFNAEAAFLGDQQHMELIFNLKEQQTAFSLFLPLPAAVPGCPINTGCCCLWGWLAVSSLKNVLPAPLGQTFPRFGARPRLWLDQDAPQTCLTLPLPPSSPL